LKKNNLFLTGLLALTLVIGFTMTGCSIEEEETGPVTLVGKWKDVGLGTPFGSYVFTEDAYEEYITDVDDGPPSYEGTFAAAGGTITLTPTKIVGMESSTLTAKTFNYTLTAKTLKLWKTDETEDDADEYTKIIGASTVTSFAIYISSSDTAAGGVKIQRGKNKYMLVNARARTGRIRSLHGASRLPM
jgi:hypothetical protein